MLEYTRAGVERRFPYCDYEIYPESEWNYGFADDGELRRHRARHRRISLLRHRAAHGDFRPSRAGRLARGIRRGRQGTALPQGHRRSALGSHDPLWLRAPAHDRDAHCGIRQRKRPKRAVRFSRAARFHNDPFSALKAIEQGDSFTSASKAIGQSAHFMQKAAPSAGSPVGRGGDSVRFQSVAQSQTFVSSSTPADCARG